MSLQPSRAGGFSISPGRSRPASSGDIRNIRLPNYQGCAPAAQALLQQLRWGYCQEPSRSGTTPSAFPDWAVSFASDDHRFFLGVERPVPLAVGFPLSLWDAAGAVVPVYCRQVVGLVLVDVKGHRFYYPSILQHPPLGSECWRLRIPSAAGPLHRPTSRRRLPSFFPSAIR